MMLKISNGLAHYLKVILGIDKKEAQGFYTWTQKKASRNLYYKSDKQTKILYEDYVMLTKINEIEEKCQESLSN